MNAERYLTTKRIYFEPTSEIRSLDGKSILIIDTEKREMPANLRVSEADPNGADAGKCSVVAWLSRTDEVNWAGDPVSLTPTTQTDNWQRFLIQDALKLIRLNDRDPTEILCWFFGLHSNEQRYAISQLGYH